ncbi:tRNA (guanine-N(7)-)-methyltransferase [Gloeothece citriformis PCC 7424]|uniref:tRNA (guanine-N(7)-)-methyltransferase n=1 Tax=Gloeothece citriformis (strain PCC 7424) TaxID=65393 RepID=B7KLF7_GLOC7|nr:tRNA (guanosine(46)-N7)-methyltransferase TrmB [Gloeothece citriformis]ACK72529.1 tRNA (guanine-N(7)-)-methyltransferase [Gloeothece citriformis PCC 7424]
MTRVRVRQHVNPLSYKYRNLLSPPDWDQVFADPTQGLHLDIGCARGKFLLNMSPLFPDINFLGTEIREPLVIEGNEYRDRLGLSNLHFLFCNINVSLDDLLKSLPESVLQWVTIQFPDPWFKQRHFKRRVVQPELVNSLGQFLRKDGMVFLQSDVESVARQMCDRFEENPCFYKSHEETWLETNPFPIPTEREIATLKKNQPVYRALYRLR